MLLKPDYYEGIIQGLEVKEYENKTTKNKFKNLVISVAILLDNSNVKLVKCYYGLDIAKKLFEGSGVKTGEATGRKVKCYVGQKNLSRENDIISFNECFSIRFLDDKGNVIFEPNTTTDAKTLDVDF